MNEIWPYLIGALPATVAAIFLFVSTRKKDESDDRSRLIDDALQLAETHKQEWGEVRTEIKVVRAELREAQAEVANLKDSIAECNREVEKWKGVAVDIAVEHKRETGRTPLAWPAGEPFPAVN